MTSSSNSGRPRAPAAQTHRTPESCVDCGAQAPQTETNFTLISQRHGWRLTRKELDGGRRVMEWRCPTCFARFRSRGR